MATNKIVDKTYLERQFKNYHRAVIKPQIAEIEHDLTTKVDKVAGYGLSKNDFTNTLKTKLEGLSNYDDTELVAAAEDNEADLDILTASDSTEGSVGQIVNDRLVQLVGGDNVSKDTLGKVSTWISGHVVSAEDMADAIESNADDIEALQAQQSAAAYEMETEDLSFASLLAPIVISGNTSVVTGNTLQLATDISGVTWVSSNDGVATVDSNTGLVTAVSAGTVIITASKIGFTAGTKEITVLDPITISGNSEVEVGGQLALVADIEEVTWSSSDNLIATVSQAGVVEGVAAGTVTITASKSGYAPALKQVTVVLPTLEVTAANDETEVAIGDTLELTASENTVLWSSSDDEVATVDNNGVVAPVAAGTVTITASKSGYNPGTIEITVVAAAPSNEDPEQGA